MGRILIAHPEVQLEGLCGSRLTLTSGRQNHKAEHVSELLAVLYTDIISAYEEDGESDSREIERPSHRNTT